MLMMEMQKRSELSSYLPKGEEEFIAHEPVQQQTHCVPQSEDHLLPWHQLEN